MLLGLLRNCPAVTMPNKKPLQAAVRSNPMALEQPRFSAMEVASPNKSSDEEVAHITKSISAGSIPDISNACCPASLANDLMLSSCCKTCRLEIPVLDLIHSSDVSTTFSKSSLLMTVAGAADPMPIGRHPREPAVAIFKDVVVVVLVDVAEVVSLLLVVDDRDTTTNEGDDVNPSTPTSSSGRNADDSFMIFKDSLSCKKLEWGLAESCVQQWCKGRRQQREAVQSCSNSRW